MRIFSFLILAALLTASRQVAATEFRSTDVHPDGYPTVEAVKFMSQRLAQLSGGKYSIKVFPNGTLGNEKDTIEQTRLGALAMTRVNIAPLNSICRTSLVPTMPFLFRTTAHMRAVLDGPVGDEILKGCESAGLIGLAFYDSGARSLYTVRKPIKSIADVKGLKVRVQASDMWVALVQAMGANATPMPFGEVYTALKTGLVDAAENNIPSYESSRHFEAARFYARTEHSMAPEVLLFSKRVWDRLSTTEQNMLRQAARESTAVMRKNWDEREARSLAAIKAAGVTIVDVDKRSFEQAMLPVYDKFINDAQLKSLVQRVRATP